jgi:hypothetical protein
LPEPDVDESLLFDALRSRGVDAHVAAWDDDAVDWRADACVIRSTWNYHLHRDAFVAWSERVAKTTPLFNPTRIVAWNSDKSYLRALEVAGIAIAPTAWIDRGASTTLRATMDARGWDDAVIKPRVSAASFSTVRARRDGLEDGVDAGERHLARMLSERDMMVQRYVRSVEGHGERSVVFIDGALTHAVRKSPRFSGGSEHVESMPIEDDERAFAERVLAHVGTRDLLYARIDVARDDAGAPLVMELELVEPSLFLSQSRVALDRFAAAIAQRARTAR